MNHFIFGLLSGAILIYLSLLSKSDFASGGVESRHAKHAGSPPDTDQPILGSVNAEIGAGECTPRNNGIAEKTHSGSSAPPAGNVSEEWVPNPGPLRPQLAIYAASDPMRAAAVALGMPTDQEDEDEAVFNDPIGAVMRVWAKADPDAATDFYERMTEPQRQLGAAFGLVEGLAANDVERAASWTEKQIAQRHPDSVAFISHVVPHMQIERAKHWLARLPLDPDAREMTKGLVAARPRGLPQ